MCVCVCGYVCVCVRVCGVCACMRVCAFPNFGIVKGDKIHTCFLTAKTLLLALRLCKLSEILKICLAVSPIKGRLGSQEFLCVLSCI